MRSLEYLPIQKKTFKMGSPMGEEFRNLKGHALLEGGRGREGRKLEKERRDDGKKLERRRGVLSRYI